MPRQQQGSSNGILVVQFRGYNEAAGKAAVLSISTERVVSCVNSSVPTNSVEPRCVSSKGMLQFPILHLLSSNTLSLIIQVRAITRASAPGGGHGVRQPPAPVVLARASAPPKSARPHTGTDAGPAWPGPFDQAAAGPACLAQCTVPRLEHRSPPGPASGTAPLRGRPL